MPEIHVIILGKVTFAAKLKEGEARKALWCIAFAATKEVR